MKTLAIIGASYLQRPLVEKAHEMGLYTLCFAWSEGAVCRDIADEFFPISILEKERILAICREKHINGICTIASDVAAPTVAYVAEQMGLLGNSYTVAMRANNKYLMREAFIHAGVPCPKYVCVNACTFHPIHRFLSQHSLSFPLIVKPSDRSGSLGVIKVENKEDLVSAVENACSCSFCHEAMIEEFVEGREISVEFISYKGQHYPLQITDKVTTDAPHFVELEHHQPSTLDKEMFGIIYNMTKTALNALGVTNGASHAEYKITADGRIYIMEIGARMGGDFIGSDLVRLSTDYDFVRGVIEVALGEFNESAVLNINFTKSKYSGVYFLCEETKHLLPILEHANQYMEIVASELTDLQLRSVTCSADRSGYFIYQSNKKFII